MVMRVLMGGSLGVSNGDEIANSTAFSDSRSPAISNRDHIANKCRLK